jgi:hypothetical protein
MLPIALVAICVALAAFNGWPAFNAVTPFVYAAFALQALLGRALRSRRAGALTAAGLGALVFFTLSNFGVWLSSGLYERSAAGLTACFVAALPFLGGTLAGDLVWTVVLGWAYRVLAAKLEGRAGWVVVAPSRLGTL